MKQFIYNNIWLMLIICLFSCSEEQVKEQEYLRPVKYLKVGFNEADKTSVFSGSAEIDRIIQLSFRATGIISELKIKVGQQVKKGQLLAKLDNLQSRLAYEQALNQLNSARSQWNTSKLNFERISALYEKGSTSLSEFEGAKNTFQTARQNFEAAERGVGIQKEQMKFGSLYAPEDGIIAEVISEVNENVAPGQTIATLNAGSRMEIRLGVPESSINSIATDDKVSVTFTSLPDIKFSGSVSEVSPSIALNSSTYPVTIVLDEATDLVKSGMTANVSFAFKEDIAQSKKIIVPADAIGEDYEGRFVFKITKDEKGEVLVNKVNVRVGKLTNNGFEILSGLGKGDLVATAGLQTLLDGQKVKLK